MNGKPLHFDGSGKNIGSSNAQPRVPFKLTDETRKYLSGNPYQVTSNK